MAYLPLAIHLIRDAMIKVVGAGVILTCQSAKNLHVTLGCSFHLNQQTDPASINKLALAFVACYHMRCERNSQSEWQVKQ